MAITNKERIGRALDSLHAGLIPYFDREMKATYGTNWILRVAGNYIDADSTKAQEILLEDLSTFFRVMVSEWNEVFGKTLGKTERNLLFECRDIRNTWAHKSTVSTDDTERALDSIARFLSVIGASQADEVAQERIKLLRLRFEEQARHQTRSKATTTEGQPNATLKPWREIATPHPDVCKGTFQEAEFAADLWEVYLDRGSDEYRDPTEFYRRTYLTNGLRTLLSNALKRLSGLGGDPVIELQTNFGGGKTHAMLALYHLCNVRAISDLPGMEDLFTELELDAPPQNVNVAVLVGNKLQPSGISNYLTQHDRQQRPTINTLWGEIAWQLGGAEGYEFIRKADETATNPGDALTTLFERYSPCLILIDEWVAYARQLHETSDLPSGSFDTQFTFAQTLSESAKNAKNTLLAVSIPASDIETGGERGREALDRLKNAIGRVESPWRPASAEESFEIVRRRLFELSDDPQKYSDRDVVVRQYMTMYRNQPQEFPSECQESSYSDRMKAAYPIHPELFDRLYTDWSTLDKFQRTRGVLRLMAKVIYTLWNNDDKNVLIMPGTLPMQAADVQSELTRYLDDNWIPIIDKDVDGAGSLPREIDDSISTLGRYSASRRVARAIYLGSAPLPRAANRGLEDRHIKLACVQPGENTATFGDALRRLSDRATYLYVENNRYWISTQPNVNRTAQDKAERILADEPHLIDSELIQRLKRDRSRTQFGGIHIAPASTADIPDASNLGVRLVIISPQHAHQRNQDDSPAILWTKDALEQRGNARRIYKNTLIFLAADRSQVESLYKTIAQYLAWKNIIQESQNEQLNLDTFQRKQAQNKADISDRDCKAKLIETYRWSIVPKQDDPQDAIHWSVEKLQTKDESPIAAIDAKALHESSLQPECAPAPLSMEVIKPWIWEKQRSHISTQELWETLSKYLYLPRLKNSDVLLASFKQGASATNWGEYFAYAEGYDEAKQRYIGLKVGELINPSLSNHALFVKPDVARKQIEADDQAKREEEERKQREEEEREKELRGEQETDRPEKVNDRNPERYRVTPPSPTPTPTPPPQTKRFFGSITLEDIHRLSREVGQVSENVIAHLAKQPGATVKISIEIEADLPEGINESDRRSVTENCNTLKFKQHSFDAE
jgi:predicted AAA+ superfamily ATPase